jgi:hypothetical protein
VKISRRVERGLLSMTVPAKQFNITKAQLTQIK